MGLFSFSSSRSPTARDEDDEVPLLEMTDTAEGDASSVKGGSSGDSISSKAAVTVQVNELASRVAEGTIPGGRMFHELSLYEKKSVLINRELECARRILPMLQPKR